MFIDVMIVYVENHKRINKNRELISNYSKFTGYKNTIAFISAPKKKKPKILQCKSVIKYTGFI